MFLRCPHCGFLVALITARDGADPRCPQCRGSLRMEAATPSPAEAAPVDDALVDAHAGDGAPQSVTDSDADADSSNRDDECGPDADTGADEDAATGAHGDVSTGGIEGPAAPAEHHSPAESEAAPPAVARATPHPPRLVTTPRFARRTLSMVDTGPRWPGIAVILGLTLLLSLQLLLSQRAQLAEHQRWRPTLERVCSVLGCSLPAWRQPEAFAMVTRSVRPSPAHPGVLEITATLRNDATREQAWPVLLLSLSDVHGRPVGARAFAPAEYRDQRTTGDTLAPGQTVTVLLDVVEPAPDTVAFSFDFR